MRSHFKTGIILLFPLQLLAVNWMAGHPQWVEKYYSTGLYPLISAFFRRLYGWVPFSVGDLIYFFLIALSIGYLIRKRHWIRHHLWTFLRDGLVALSVLHFTFYLLW